MVCFNFLIFPFSFIGLVDFLDFLYSLSLFLKSLLISLLIQGGQFLALVVLCRMYFIILLSSSFEKFVQSISTSSVISELFTKFNENACICSFSESQSAFLYKGTFLGFCWLILSLISISAWTMS